MAAFRAHQVGVAQMVTASDRMTVKRWPPAAPNCGVQTASVSCCLGKVCGLLCASTWAGLFPCQLDTTFVAAMAEHCKQHPLPPWCRRRPAGRWLA